ncbi:hypothetical protein GCM10022379_40970 [Micromonospora maritima]
MQVPLVFVEERDGDRRSVGVQDLVDRARRTNEKRGHRVRLVPTWSSSFGPEMAGDVLLPDAGARIAPTTFDEWLAEQR